MTPWLVTRAFDEATPLVERLERAGLAAAALPCIERRPIEWVPDLGAWAGRTTVFMVTSPFGARRLIDYWPKLKDHGLVAALSPTTAQVVESAGIPVSITGTGGASGLAEAVVTSRTTRGAVVIWLTSAAGLVEPEQEQAAAVLRSTTELQRIVAYETRSPDALAGELQRWHGKRASAVFFSPSACRNFLGTRHAIATGPVLERIVCVGQSTLRSWSQLRPRGMPAAVYQASEDAFVGWAAAQR
ncbi:MAG TPA: uroporphyrinogen-III synthase [Steroidobacteraceae bacterium]|nr:uroporphyrinogen-III synthase [Steroidobacteraceae bacterium]